MRSRLPADDAGVSALEYLLVSSMLIGCFYFSAMLFMAILNWLYLYWTTVIDSPII